MALGNKWTHNEKHVISIGGGVASTLELPLHVIDKYGADNVDMFICALKGESPDLWRMVDWIEQRTGKHVTRVAWQPRERSIYHNLRRNYWVDAPMWAWSDIWVAFNQTGRMGSSLADPCSRMLKRDTAKAFMLDHYDPDLTTMHVGITASEIDRMLAIQANWSRNGFKVAAELADVERTGTSAERATEILGWTPFVYAWGGSHNNCNGFCVKAGHAQMARLLWYAREVFLYHERKEAEFQIKHGTDATIMRDRVTIDGKVISTPLSLRQFRERMEARWSSAMFDPFDDLEDTPGCVFCSAA